LAFFSIANTIVASIFNVQLQPHVSKLSGIAFHQFINCSRRLDCSRPAPWPQRGDMVLLDFVARYLNNLSNTRSSDFTASGSWLSIDFEEEKTFDRSFDKMAQGSVFSWLGLDTPGGKRMAYFSMGFMTLGISIRWYVSTYLVVPEEIRNQREDERLRIEQSKRRQELMKSNAQYRRVVEAARERAQHVEERSNGRVEESDSANEHR
jgi:hypothetical protein